MHDITAPRVHFVLRFPSNYSTTQIKLGQSFDLIFSSNSRSKELNSFFPCSKFVQKRFLDCLTFGSWLVAFQFTKFVIFLESWKVDRRWKLESAKLNNWCVKVLSVYVACFSHFLSVYVFFSRRLAKQKKNLRTAEVIIGISKFNFWKIWCDLRLISSER